MLLDLLFRKPCVSETCPDIHVKVTLMTFLAPYFFKKLPELSQIYFYRSLLESEKVGP